MWNMNVLCRCCLAEGSFKAPIVCTPGVAEDDFTVLIKDTFDISVSIIYILIYLFYLEYKFNW